MTDMHIHICMYVGTNLFESIFSAAIMGRHLRWCMQTAMFSRIPFYIVNTQVQVIERLLVKNMFNKYW